MTSTVEALQEEQLFAHLKTQILSLATALYGAHTSRSVFDILTYTLPSPGPSSFPDSLSMSSAHHSHYNKDEQITYGVALITYPPSNFTSWTIICTSSHHASLILATRAMLSDLRAGTGAVLHALVQREQTEVRHPRIPDTVSAEEQRARNDTSSHLNPGHETEAEAETGAEGQDMVSERKKGGRPSLDSVPEDSEPSDGGVGYETEDTEEMSSSPDTPMSRSVVWE